MSNVNSINGINSAYGAAGVSGYSEAYLAILEDLGYNAGIDILDNASLSARYAALKGVNNLATEDSNYVRNLEKYDNKYGQIEGQDSFFVSYFDESGSFITEAFGYSDLTDSFNSADSYINPFDQAVISLLNELYTKNILNNDQTSEQKIAALYNYIINNFSYINEEKDDWNFAGETILQRGGDCEDLSILLASLGMALLINEGVSYEEANARFAVVAGTHTLYGDHVYVEYTHADGKVYVLDAAVAEQAEITALSQLLLAAERTDFTVYYRFNDNAVLGVLPAAAENKTESYIDPKNSTVQEILTKVKAEGYYGQDLTLDQLVTNTYKYLKDNYSYLDLSDLSINFQRSFSTGSLNSESFACLMMSLVLAAAEDFGFDKISADEMRVALLENSAGEQAMVFLYDEHIFDISGKIVKKEPSAPNCQAVGDVLVLYDLDDFPETYYETGLKELESYDLENNIYKRSVTRFTPKSLLQGTNGKFVVTSRKNYVDSNQLAYVSTFDPYNSLGKDKSVASVIADLVSKYDGVFGDNFKSVNGIKYTDNPDYSLRGTGWTNDIKYGMQEAMAGMANLGDFVDYEGGFWIFDAEAYDAHLIKLNRYQNIQSMIAMLMEEKFNAQSIVMSEMNESDPDMLQGREGYKSMSGSSIIKAENDFLSKGVSAMRNDITSAIDSRNQLLKATAENYFVKEMEHEMSFEKTFLSFFVGVVAASIVGYIGQQVANALFPVVPAGPALHTVADKIVDSVLKGAINVLGVATVGAFQIRQQWLKTRQTEANAEIADRYRKAEQKNNDNMTRSLSSFYTAKTTGNRAEYNCNAICDIYDKLNTATTINAKKVNTFAGWFGSGKFEDDKAYLKLEKEIKSSVLLLKAYNKITSEARKSRSVVHQEMTDKNTYSSSALSEEAVTREIAQIENILSRYKETRSSYFNQHNEANSLQEEYSFERFKAITMTTCFAVGVVGNYTPYAALLGLGFQMTLASVINSSADLLWTREYKPPTPDYSYNWNKKNISYTSNSGTTIDLKKSVRTYGNDDYLYYATGKLFDTPYSAVNREVFNDARKECLNIANFQRLIMIIEEYRKSARDIIHQEMTNKASYTQSSLPEEVLSKELAYEFSAIGAISSRATAISQYHNKLKARWNPAQSNLILGSFGLGAGLLAYSNILGSALTSIVVTAAYLAAFAGKVTIEYAKKDSDYNINVDGLKFKGVDLDQSGNRKFSSLKDSVTGQSFGNYVQDVGDGPMGQKKYFVRSTTTYDGGGVKAWGMDSVIQSFMYASKPLHAWSSLIKAKSEARSIIHQEMTNVSSKQNSSGVNSSIEGYDQLNSARASAFTQTLNEYVSLKQRQNQAKVNQEWEILSLLSLGVSAAGYFVIAGFVFGEGLSSKIFGGESAAGSLFNNILLMSSIIQSIIGLVRAVYSYNQKDQSAEIKNAILNKEGIIDSFSETQKKSRNAIGASESETAAPEEKDPYQSTGDLLVLQGKLKEIQKLHEAMQKVAQAQKEARANIKGKTGGIRGSTGGNLAATMLSINNQVADSLMNIIIGLAKAQEKYHEEQENKDLAQTFQAAIGLLKTLIQGAKDIKDGKFTKAAGQKVFNSTFRPDSAKLQDGDITNAEAYNSKKEKLDVAKGTVEKLKKKGADNGLEDAEKLVNDLQKNLNDMTTEKSAAERVDAAKGQEAASIGGVAKSSFGGTSYQTNKAHFGTAGAVFMMVVDILNKLLSGDATSLLAPDARSDAKKASASEGEGSRARDAENKFSQAIANQAAMTEEERKICDATLAKDKDTNITVVNSAIGNGQEEVIQNRTIFSLLNKYKHSDTTAGEKKEIAEIFQLYVNSDGRIMGINGFRDFGNNKDGFYIKYIKEMRKEKEAAIKNIKETTGVEKSENLSIEKRDEAARNLYTRATQHGVNITLTKGEGDKKKSFTVTQYRYDASKEGFVKNREKNYVDGKDEYGKYKTAQEHYQDDKISADGKEGMYGHGYLLNADAVKGTGEDKTSNAGSWSLWNASIQLLTMLENIFKYKHEENQQENASDAIEKKIAAAAAALAGGADANSVMLYLGGSLEQYNAVTKSAVIGKAEAVGDAFKATVGVNDSLDRFDGWVTDIFAQVMSKIDSPLAAEKIADMSSEELEKYLQEYDKRLVNEIIKIYQEAGLSGVSRDEVEAAVAKRRDDYKLNENISIMKSNDKNNDRKAAANGIVAYLNADNLEVGLDKDGNVMLTESIKDDRNPSSPRTEKYVARTFDDPASLDPTVKSIRLQNLDKFKTNKIQPCNINQELGTVFVKRADGSVGRIGLGKPNKLNATINGKSYKVFENITLADTPEARDAFGKQLNAEYPKTKGAIVKINGQYYLAEATTNDYEKADVKFTLLEEGTTTTEINGEKITVPDFKPVNNATVTLDQLKESIETKTAGKAFKKQLSAPNAPETYKLNNSQNGKVYNEFKNIVENLGNNKEIVITVNNDEYVIKKDEKGEITCTRTAQTTHSGPAVFNRLQADLQIMDKKALEGGSIDGKVLQGHAEFVNEVADRRTEAIQVKEYVNDANRIHNQQKELDRHQAHTANHAKDNHIVNEQINSPMNDAQLAAVPGETLLVRGSIWGAEKLDKIGTEGFSHDYTEMTADKAKNRRAIISDEDAKKYTDKNTTFNSALKEISNGARDQIIENIKAGKAPDWAELKEKYPGAVKQIEALESAYKGSGIEQAVIAKDNIVRKRANEIFDKTMSAADKIYSIQEIAQKKQEAITEATQDVNGDLQKKATENENIEREKEILREHKELKDIEKSLKKDIKRRVLKLQKIMLAEPQIIDNLTRRALWASVSTLREDSAVNGVLNAVRSYIVDPEAAGCERVKLNKDEDGYIVMIQGKEQAVFVNNLNEIGEYKNDGNCWYKNVEKTINGEKKMVPEPVKNQTIIAELNSAREEILDLNNATKTLADQAKLLTTLKRNISMGHTASFVEDHLGPAYDREKRGPFSDADTARKQTDARNSTIKFKNMKKERAANKAVFEQIGSIDTMEIQDKNDFLEKYDLQEISEKSGDTIIKAANQNNNAGIEKELEAAGINNKQLRQQIAKDIIAAKPADREKLIQKEYLKARYIERNYSGISTGYKSSQMSQEEVDELGYTAIAENLLEGKYVIKADNVSGPNENVVEDSGKYKVVVKIGDREIDLIVDNVTDVTVSADGKTLIFNSKKVKREAFDANKDIYNKAAADYRQRRSKLIGRLKDNDRTSKMSDTVKDTRFIYNPLSPEILTDTEIFPEVYDKTINITGREMLDNFINEDGTSKIEREDVKFKIGNDTYVVKKKNDKFIIKEDRIDSTVVLSSNKELKDSFTKHIVITDNTQVGHLKKQIDNAAPGQTLVFHGINANGALESYAVETSDPNAVIAAKEKVTEYAKNYGGIVMRGDRPSVFNGTYYYIQENNGELKETTITVKDGDVVDADKYAMNNLQNNTFNVYKDTATDIAVIKLEEDAAYQDPFVLQNRIQHMRNRPLMESGLPVAYNYRTDYPIFEMLEKYLPDHQDNENYERREERDKEALDYYNIISGRNVLPANTPLARRTKSTANENNHLRILKEQYKKMSANHNLQVSEIKYDIINKRYYMETTINLTGNKFIYYVDKETNKIKSEPLLI